MITIDKFIYKVTDQEAETASSAYLMSLVALMVGLPIPIVNLIATFLFYLNTRKSSYFVRWHSMQALLSQASMLFINSTGFWWTVSIITGNEVISNSYIAYIIAAILFNLAEFSVTIYTAIQIRKGIHVVWWLYGDVSNKIVNPQHVKNIL